MPTYWHVAQTKSNGTERALANLAQQGFETFLPRQASSLQAQRRRQVRVQPSPLFPCYIFIRFDPKNTQWHRINNTFGVSRLIASQADRPARMPPSVMEALLKRCDADGVLKPPDDLTLGDKVRIIDGPFAGWVTEVVRLPEGERVMVLLSLLGEKNRAKVPLRSLRKI